MCSVTAQTPTSDFNGRSIYNIFGFLDINGTDIFQNGTQVPIIGDCSADNIVVNITSSGVECIAIANLNVNSSNSTDFWDDLNTFDDFTTVTASGQINAGEFSGPQNWTDNQNYPGSGVACTTSETLTGLADTLTCTAISLSSSQVSASGSDTQIQYNNGSDFGGANFTYNDVNGNVNLTTTTASLNLPQFSDAATPTLAFGDGDTGLYESLDDVLRFSLSSENILILSSAAASTENVLITASASTEIPLKLKGAASQSANFFEVETSTGSTLLFVDSVGGVFADGKLNGSNFFTDGVATRNVFVGFETADGSSGTIITAVGFQAYKGGTQSNAVAIGRDSGKDNTGASFTAVGTNSGSSNTGTKFTGVGFNAGFSNTGASVTTMGSNSGFDNTGSFSVMVGDSAGMDNTNDGLTALGYFAGQDNSANNVAVVGRSAGEDNSGVGLSAIGFQAGKNNSGDAVMAVGRDSMSNNNQSNSLGIGFASGFNNRGSDLVAVGYRAGQNNSGNFLIAIGTEAGKDNTLDNQYILIQADVSVIPLIQGDFSTGDLSINGFINITDTQSGTDCILAGPFGCAIGQNATCTFIFSPDESTTTEVCNV